ncbi:hypothetical protein [Hyalangium versicolor]|uniref:hypothetical protein n=1 Tax=Hyalangium versicolor TaxID=2861190 RepID=UPI001CCCA9AC|nr:hypothetical protein [Hyalangium versicolor]
MLSAACSESSSAEPEKVLDPQGSLPPEVARVIQSSLAGTNVSSSIRVNPSPVWGETQQHPAVAQGLGVYLVVWEVNSSAAGSSPDIVGLRVRASDGVVLDSSPLPIATGSYSQTEPAVAFDGTYFTVLWTEDRGVPAIYGTRVRASDGTRVDSTAFPVSHPLDTGPQQRGQTHPTLACDGKNCLVSWYDTWTYSDGSGLHFVEVAFLRSSDATLVDSGLRVLSTSASAPPRVTFGSGYYLVSWVEGTTLKVNPFDARTTGYPSPVTVTTTADAQTPAVAGQGGEFLVTWLEGGNILARRVKADTGAVLGSANTLVGTSAMAPPEVTADGVDYRVLWNSMRDGYPHALSTRVSALAMVGANAELDVGYAWPNRGDLAAAASGLYLTASVLDEADGGPRVNLRLVTEGQVHISPERTADPLRTMYAPHYTPTIGTGNGINLVLWTQPGAGFALRGVRVRASDGQVLDSAPITFDTTNLNLDPVVAFDGQNFLVAWVRLAAAPVIYGTRVRASDGAVLDASPILLSRLPAGTPVSQLNSPSVAYGNDIFMITWDGPINTNGSVVSGVQGIRMHRYYGTESQSFLIAQGGKDSRVAFSGDKFLVTWERNQNIEAARIGLGGGVMDNPVISLAASSGNERSPAAAGLGGNFLVTWVGADNNLWARAVSGSDGSRLGTGDLAVGTAPLTGPEITSDGRDYWIGWQSTRSGLHQMIGTRVSALGTLEADLPLSYVDPATSQSMNSTQPQFGIAALSPGVFAVAYLQQDLSMGYATTGYRLVTANPSTADALVSEVRANRAGCVYAIQARSYMDPNPYPHISYRFSASVWPDASGTCTATPSTNALGASESLPGFSIVANEAGIAVGYSESYTYKAIGTLSNGFVALLDPQTAGVARRYQFHGGWLPADCTAGGPGSARVGQLSFVSPATLVVEGSLGGNTINLWTGNPAFDIYTGCDGISSAGSAFTATLPGFFTTPEAPSIVMH